MNWVKESAEDSSKNEEGHNLIVAQLDEIQTYLGRKSHKI
jgi:hypothetical protein